MTSADLFAALPSPSITRKPLPDAPTPVISNCLPKIVPPTLELAATIQPSVAPPRVARFSSPHTPPIVVTRPLKPLTLPQTRRRRRHPVALPTWVDFAASNNQTTPSGVLADTVVAGASQLTGYCVGLALRRLAHQIKTQHYEQLVQFSSLPTSQVKRATPTPRGAVVGIPNYGQTCFLNSVLQALAALEPFCAYVEQIGNSQDAVDTLCQNLAELLAVVNGQVDQPGVIDPRWLLERVGTQYTQFQSKFGGVIGKEQQDAEELLQALVDVVVGDAELDATPSVLATTRFQSLLELDENSDDEDEILTVVSGARERRRQEAGLIGTTIVGKEVNGKVSPTQGDEKKQDEYSFTDPFLETIDSVDGESISLGSQNKERQLSAAMRMLVSSTSSITPSPLCGWMGSALQCRSCHHVRPIQNAPFLDIPVVPTAVSVYLSKSGDPSHRSGAMGPPCTLEECLEEFTSVERVQGVECRSCTHRQVTQDLEDEAEMLRGAIDALESRAKRLESTDDPAKHLKDELDVIEAKLGMLQVTSPDEEGSLEQILGGPVVEGERPSVPIVRSDAFKCLLLTRLPSILCIHIQRRYYDPLTDRMSKTEQHVMFPEYLDVGPYCAYGGALDASWAGTPREPPSSASSSRQPIRYRLESAIEHRGGAFYGHYVNYRRDPASGRWLYISDDRVHVIDWQDVRTCQAYMLFYEAV